MKEDKKIKFRNIIEYEILDEKGNIVEKNRVENTDTLVARCVITENPHTYLNCGITNQNPIDVLGVSDFNEAYRYMKANYNFLLNFELLETSSFSRIDDNSISTIITWANTTGSTQYIYFVSSYYDNKKVAFTYHLFDPPLEILNGYSLNLTYYIYIENYPNYKDELLSTSKEIVEDRNDVLINVYCDDIARDYKYTRLFTKTKPYLGLIISDYSATVSNPTISLIYSHPDKKSNILSANNTYNEWLSFEFYFRFLEDGDVGSTNALIFGGYYNNTLGYNKSSSNNKYHFFRNLLFTDEKNDNRYLSYDPQITEYTNAFIVRDDGTGLLKIYTGHYDPNTYEFTETGDDINLKPLKRSIVDFPLIDGVNTLKEFFKMCFLFANHRYANLIGVNFWREYYMSRTNSWLTTFYSNLDKKLKYYLHWDSSETDPYFYIVTNKEISQIDFDGTIVDNTTITPYHHSTVDLTEPYPREYDGSNWVYKTQDEIYIYKIHLNNYIDVSSTTSCKTIVSFVNQPQIVFCYKSNCFVVAIDCDEKIVNTNDTTGEDALISRSKYKTGYYDNSNWYTYHKVKQYPLSKLNTNVAKISNESIPYQLSGYYENIDKKDPYLCMLENPQLVFNSVIFNNVSYSFTGTVELKDNTNTTKYIAYVPNGNIVKDVDNDIVHVFGHTYWQFRIDNLREHTTDVSGQYGVENTKTHGYFLFIRDQYNNTLSILLPFCFPSYFGYSYHEDDFLDEDWFYNMFQEKVKNFSVASVKTEIESQTIDLFGKQFYMYTPIQNNTQIGQLTFNFSNASVSPTFIQGEFLSVPCCNKWLISDSLEKWRVFENEVQIPSNNPYSAYLEDYSADIGFQEITKLSNTLPYLSNKNNSPTGYEEETCAPIFEIEVPDEIYKKWNTLYFDPQHNIIKYRMLYFVEDVSKFSRETNDDKQSVHAITLLYPKTINTSSGPVEVEPVMVLLDNREEVPFSFDDNPDTSKISGIGHVNVHIHKYRFWDYIYWRQKNNFLIYVYFKDKNDTNTPFIREFRQGLPPETTGNLRKQRYRLISFDYPGDKYKIDCRRGYVIWDNLKFKSVKSELISIEEANMISSLEYRTNIFRWLPVQMPAFMKLINPIVVTNFGEDEKTIYEHFNVNPSDTNNKIIPKTFYLDAQDFGELNYECLQNVRDGLDDKELLVYFGWGYEPENRPGNDLSTIYPIINVEKIRNVFGDNFKITDLNGNEIEWWYVTGKEFYTDTHTISTTPTNYIMLNLLGRSPRDNGSGYNDQRQGPCTYYEEYRSNIFTSFSYNWDRKNKQNIVYKYYNNLMCLDIQPSCYWDHSSFDFYYPGPNFRMWDNHTNDISNKNPEKVYNICLETCFRYTNSINYWVGKPYPIPGFFPSFWFDFIIRHNKPNIALDVIRVVKDTTSHNSTTTPSINAKIVDSQFEIEKPDLSGRVKVYHQSTRKLVKQDVKWIYSIEAHEFNKHYLYRNYPIQDYNHQRSTVVCEDRHKVRYIVKVENQDETVTKYYHYDIPRNKWIEITDKINSDDDFINYGFDWVEMNTYGHKLNELMEDYMSDTDKLSFVIAIKNDPAPTITTNDYNVNIDETTPDEYAFVEIWGISIEAEFNNPSYYREIPWCWIDVNTHQLLTDITGKNKNEVAVALQVVPTHWIKWEITNVGTPNNTLWEDQNRFYQLPLKVYIYHSSFRENETGGNHTLKYHSKPGTPNNFYYLFLDMSKYSTIFREDDKL